MPPGLSRLVAGRAGWLYQEGKTMANKLRQEFDYIRLTFYPRWDRPREWRVRQVPDLHGARGLCVTESKTVKLDPVGDDIDELHLVLIHEIAHAAASLGHDRKWLARMRKAADQAERIGRTELAEMLRKEATGYEESKALGVGSHADVYGQIEDLVVIEGMHDSDFLEVVDLVRRYAGDTRADFLANYRRARKVYDKAVREAKQIIKNQEERRQRLAESKRV